MLLCTNCLYKGMHTYMCCMKMPRTSISYLDKVVLIRNNSYLENPTMMIILAKKKCSSMKKFPSKYENTYSLLKNIHFWQFLSWEIEYLSKDTNNLHKRKIIIVKRSINSSLVKKNQNGEILVGFYWILAKRTIEVKRRI